jgi:hypothetical protein
VQLLPELMFVRLLSDDESDTGEMHLRIEFGRLIRIISIIREEIRSRLNSGDTCYHAI